jgi:hypothetical protein
VKLSQFWDEMQRYHPERLTAVPKQPEVVLDEPAKPPERRFQMEAIADHCLGGIHSQHWKCSAPWCECACHEEGAYGAFGSYHGWDGD